MSMKTAYKYRENETAAAYAGFAASSQTWLPAELTDQFSVRSSPIAAPKYFLSFGDETGAAGSYTIALNTIERIVYGTLTGQCITALSRDAPIFNIFEAKTYGANTTTTTLINTVAETIAGSVGAARNIEAEFVDDPFEGYDQYSNPNWDGFDAEQITPETLRCARKILRALPHTFGDAHIAPGADGSIGFYWSTDKRSFKSLCIDVGPGQKWRAYWRLRDGHFGRLPSRRFDDRAGAALASLFRELSR